VRPYSIAAAFVAVFSPAGFGQVTKPASPVSVASAMATQNLADWRFAYPGAAVRMSFNLGRILRLPAVADAMKNAPSATQAQMSLGLKMIQGIEKVQMSVRPTPGNTAGNTPANKDADILMLVTGQLDPQLSQLITQQGSAKAMVSRQVAPNVLLLGKAAHVELAARRMLGAPLTGAPDSLSESDIWIGGDAALMNSLGKGASAPPGLDALKKFSLGVNIGDPFDLNINLLSANEAGADKLLSLYNLAMASVSGQTPKEFAPLVERIQAGKQGNEVRFHFSAPVAMLQAAFANSQALQGAGSAAGLSPALAGLFGGAATSFTGAPSPAPVPESAPSPKKPGKITIYGLDEGTREIVVPGKN